MTTVLIAVDDSDDAVVTASVAHELFGELSDYYVINVGQVQPGMPWAVPYPMVGAGAMYPQMWESDVVDGTPAPEEAAESRASHVADEAHLSHATPLGRRGDPATAILRAAHEHHADVVVIGSHEHGWFSRLLLGSVTEDVMREADLPVLVVR